MKMIKWFAVSALMTLFAACGGGGGSAGTSTFGSGSGSSGGSGSGGTNDAGSSLVLSISSTTASAATPATVTATLKSSSGAVLPGQVISFSSAGGLGTFSVSSALTDANGQATVKVTPASSTSNGADLVLAKTTVGTTPISGSIGFQVSPGAGPLIGVPSISVTLSTNSVTTATPATLTATVRDAAGALLPGQVVKFSTAAGNLGALNVSSALSDANGVVTAKLTPASSTANGADLVIVQATVANTLVTGSLGFSVTSMGSTQPGAPSISLTLSTNTVTTATPATVTATVKDATGAGVVGQVVKFSTVDGLGALTVSSALTDNTGSASTTLNATSATQSGADQVIATATVNGTALQASQGFRLTAASVAIASFTADVSSLGAYGQTGVQLALSGTIPGTPVSVSVTSACIASGKATVTPATATTTNGVASFTYRDAGCGATSATDTLRASITGSAATSALSLAIASPAATSINFISAKPPSIFLKGSGLGETSIVTFRVLDIAGNGLPGQLVRLRATTFAGGLTLDGVSGPMLNGDLAHDDLVFPPKPSDSLGNVTVRINSGTVPTPVRVTASLVDNPATTTINEALITTVSSSLAIAVGAPSQLNFSLSQGTRNIEGYDIDGTPNTYNIITSDRLGNPVPDGTTVNFATEGGGQIEPIKMTLIDAKGNARATANFISSAPRPLDGHITVIAYELGEESFIDLNGNNVWDTRNPRATITLSATSGPAPVDVMASAVTAAPAFVPSDVGLTLSAPAPAGTTGAVGLATITQYVSATQVKAQITTAFSSTVFAADAYSIQEPFQDLGSLYIDRYNNGVYNKTTDQYISLSLPGGVATANCVVSGTPLLALDSSIPSIPSLTAPFPAFVPPSTPTACDGVWGKAYVRRAIETVLSTSSARPVWPTVPPNLYAYPGLSTCFKAQDRATTPGTAQDLIVGYRTDETAIRAPFTLADGGVLYNAAGSYVVLATDANPVRLNPMPAGTKFVATGTLGLAVQPTGGTPTVSTIDPFDVGASFSVAFMSGTTSGTVTLTFLSPGGTGTSIGVAVVAGNPPVGSVPCP